jgi:hypothetical protein
MCLRRASEEYITGAALDRAGLRCQVYFLMHVYWEREVMASLHILSTPEWEEGCHMYVRLISAIKGGLILFMFIVWLFTRHRSVPGRYKQSSLKKIDPSNRPQNTKLRFPLKQFINKLCPSTQQH